ncbi:cupin domain-containing protein [Namhaeicola litoreus]|uniref:Cupin domain-containing protein n=1 Tax=Namhaeicola litoreus TaxID=1052145 RepID=A0ABW3Y1L4_9FLAO
MNSFLKISISLITLLFFGCQSTTQEKDISTSSELIFPKGNQLESENFKGNVWFIPLIENDSLNQNAVGSVTFEPGARTHWHYHPGGQILLAIKGIGYYQEKGSPRRKLQKGDAVKCPPNTPHWHGASPEGEFVQVAITGRADGPTVWLEPVSEAEYNGLTKH